MKIITEKIEHFNQKIVDVCCKDFQSQLDYYHHDMFGISDGKITCDGVYINYCPFCGKKMEVD